MKKFLMAAAGAAALVLAASSANAAVIIGVSFNGGATTTVASGTNSASFSGVVGSFDINNITGSLGPSGLLLDTSSINTALLDGASGGVLNVYITRNDITGPIPTFGFLSGFTTNLLSAGWTVQEQTFVSAANANFTGTQIGNTTFLGAPGLQTDSDFAAGIVGAGPYSVTAQYTITATPGSGRANSTISITAVPEPATWAFMIGGFGLAGAMLRSRRRTMAAVA